MTTGSAPLGADELEVLRAMSVGDPLRRIARDLNISERTVRRRIRVACEGLDVDTPIEAVVLAVRNGWI